METYSTSLIIRDMQITTAKKCHLTLVRMTIIKNSINNTSWRGCGGVAPLVCFWWECKLVQPLWRIVSILFSHSVVSLSDPMDCSTPSLRVHHRLLEFTQTHVHWVGDAIQPSVVPFSSCLQSFPASGSFPMSQFCASGGQSIGVSASASVLPMNIQDWFPLVWTGWVSLESKGLSRVFSNTTVQKHQFFMLSFLYSPTLT